MLERVSEEVAKSLKNESSKLDFVLSISAVDDGLMQTIETVGPYGARNAQPVFAFSSLTVSFAKRTKGDHVRFTFANEDGRSISGICFRAGESGLDEALLMAGSQKFHALGQLKPNVWQGRTRIDFHLQDLAPVHD